MPTGCCNFPTSIYNLLEICIFIFWKAARTSMLCWIMCSGSILITCDELVLCQEYKPHVHMWGRQGVRTQRRNLRVWGMKMEVGRKLMAGEDRLDGAHCVMWICHQRPQHNTFDILTLLSLWAGLMFTLIHLGRNNFGCLWHSGITSLVMAQQIFLNFNKGKPLFQ